MVDTNENLFAEGGIEFGSDKKVEEKSEYELIEEGTYEVTLEQLQPKTSTKNGKNIKYINITFVIRDDVEQKFKKRRIWYTIFAREGDVAYNFNEINSLIITQEKRKDYKRHFRNIDEIFQYLIGLHLRLDIGIEFNQFKGKDDNIIVENSFKYSQWDIDHSNEEKIIEKVVVSEEDLPF